MTVRWLSQDEFRNGGTASPYPPEVRVTWQRLRAVPASEYHWWLLGAVPVMLSALNRRRKALLGCVCVPTASLERRRRRKAVVIWSLVADVALLALAIAQVDVAVFGLLLVSFIILPAAGGGPSCLGHLGVR